MHFFLKNITGAYMLLLVAVKVMALPLIILQFSVNQEYIAANLCENRSKPVLRCHGKCQLDKQIARSVETPASQDNKGNTKITTVDFVESLLLLSFSYDVQTAGTYNLHTNQHRVTGFHTGVFHPPGVA